MLRSFPVVYTPPLWNKYCCQWVARCRLTRFLLIVCSHLGTKIRSLLPYLFNIDGKAIDVHIPFIFLCDSYRPMCKIPGEVSVAYGMNSLEILSQTRNNAFRSIMRAMKSAAYVNMNALQQSLTQQIREFVACCISFIFKPIFVSNSTPAGLRFRFSTLGFRPVLTSRASTRYSVISCSASSVYRRSSSKPSADTFPVSSTEMY